MKLYTLDNQFIKEVYSVPDNFTGIGIYFDGSRDWYCKGKRHRIDGPAIEYNIGDKEYWIYGKYCTKEQHVLLVDLMKFKGLI